MNFDYLGAFGVLAGCFTFASVWPQVIQSYKTKRTKDLSMDSIKLCATELFLWGLYGAAVQDVIIEIAAFAAFIGYGCLGYLKWRYK